MKNELKSKQESISSQTAALTKKIIEATDKYISEFNKDEIFAFSSKKQHSEKYTEKYYLYLSGISKYISQLTALNAELASLLIQADKAMEIELILLCEKNFNAFEKFEHALYNYTFCVENELINSNASATFLINSAQTFKIAATNLMNENL